MTKRQQTTEQKKTQIVQKKKSPEGEPRTWFSHPKMHVGGFLGPLGSKTPNTQPQNASKQQFVAYLRRRFLVHSFKNNRNAPANLCAFGNAIFNNIYEHCK